MVFDRFDGVCDDKFRSEKNKKCNDYFAWKFHVLVPIPRLWAYSLVAKASILSTARPSSTSPVMRRGSNGSCLTDLSLSAWILSNR